MQKFTDALQKGMDFVQSHTPEEIAEIIEPQFPETDLQFCLAQSVLQRPLPGSVLPSLP